MFYKSNKVLFRACIPYLNSWGESSENAQKLAKVMHNRFGFPNPLRVLMRLCEHGKSALLLNLIFYQREEGVSDRWVFNLQACGLNTPPCHYMDVFVSCIEFTSAVTL